METKILQIVGQVAGIGGIALGILLILFREIIRKNIFPNLTKEQAYKLLRLIVILVWTVALAGLVCWVYVKIKSPNKVITSNSALPQTSLVLTMTKEGWLDIKAGGRVYEFTLSNPMNGIAIVESVSVEVLDVIEDRCPQLEAILAKFKYSINLKPDFRGRQTVAEGFEYGPGDTDQFAVLLKSSKSGYDYFFRFVIVWHDTLMQEKKESFSGVFVARYPSPGIPYERGDEEVKRKFHEHNEKVWILQSEIEEKLTGKFSKI
jgi:hypothetical protein